MGKRSVEDSRYQGDLIVKYLKFNIVVIISLLLCGCYDASFIERENLKLELHQVKIELEKVKEQQSKLTSLNKEKIDSDTMIEVQQLIFKEPEFDNSTDEDFYHLSNKFKYIAIEPVSTKGSYNVIFADSNYSYQIYENVAIPLFIFKNLYEINDTHSSQYLRAISQTGYAESLQNLSGIDTPTDKKSAIMQLYTNNYKF